MIEFAVYGTAQPAGSKKIVTHPKTKRPIVIDDSKGSRPWKREVAKIAKRRMTERELLDGPLHLTLVFVMPRPKGHYGTGRNAGTLRPAAPRWPTVKPDATKLLRCVEDALTGIVWHDDAQIVHQNVSKRYAPPGTTPHVQIFVDTVDEAPQLRMEEVA